MKLYTYSAFIAFEAEDDDAAEQLLQDYLESGDCDLSLYDPCSWGLASVDELEE